MKINQIHIRDIAETSAALEPLRTLQPDLILAFGAVPFFSSPTFAARLTELAPQAAIAGCSTAGEIAVDRVYDNSCIVTAIKFEHTHVKVVATTIRDMNDSKGAGARLAKLLPHENLAAILLFGTGVAINGSALATGLQAGIPPQVTISGGLAADAGAFKQTWTLGSDGVADDQIVAIGLYGDKIHLGYGTFAGWEPFGPARKVTRCVDNILYELDGERALDIYKSYLGAYAKDLPGSGLLFPFEMLGETQEKNGIFRTILGVDEKEGSLTLAGDIDPKGYLKLMHSTTEKLIDGAETAARKAAESMRDGGSGGLAILVSCIGRKLVMGDRVDEEVEAVADLLGKNTSVTGFYSNGEIAGSSDAGSCRLHNQTMTISWVTEA